MSTIPLALRARARILAAQQELDAPEDSEQGDPSKAHAPPGADEPETVDNAVADETPKMDPNQEDPVGDNEEDLDAFTLEDVIECFLRANSTPSDEQVHALAGLLGLDFEEFEAVIYKKFGEAVKLGLEKRPSEIDEDKDEGEGEGDGIEVDDEIVDEDDTGTDLIADDALDVQDDIDLFVVAYILFNPTPSDEQIHQLAYVIDLTKDEMEQRIYRMLGSYLSAEDDDDELDEDEAEIDEDGDGEDTDIDDANEGDDNEPDDADEDVDEEDDADAEDAGDNAEPGDNQGDAKGKE